MRLCSAESAFITLRALLNGERISQLKDAGRLKTTRLSNTIVVLRDDCGLRNEILTVWTKSQTTNRHFGEYYLKHEADFKKCNQVLELLKQKMMDQSAA